MFCVQIFCQFKDYKYLSFCLVSLYSSRWHFMNINFLISVQLNFPFLFAFFFCVLCKNVINLFSETDFETFYSFIFIFRSQSLTDFSVWCKGGIQFQSPYFIWQFWGLHELARQTPWRDVSLLRIILTTDFCLAFLGPFIFQMGRILASDLLSHSLRFVSATPVLLT